MNTVALEEARKRRNDFIVAKVKNAIDTVLAEGTTPSFYNISARAQVARSTLYRRADLRELVESARNAVQDAQLVSSAILERLQQDKRELQEEIRRLEAKLGCLCGNGRKESLSSSRFEYAVIGIPKAA